MTVSNWAYSKMTDEERIGLTGRELSDLCFACAARITKGIRRTGEIRELRSREEVIEDYAMIRDEVPTVRAAAERMGMTYKALDKALYRARRRGDERAQIPLASLEKMIAAGRPAPRIG